MTDPSLSPSLRELLNGISTDVQLLVSQTLALARLEVSAAASKLAWSAVGLLASVFVAAAGAAVLVSALVLILIALGVPAWAASTLVGVILTGAGAISARHFVECNAPGGAWHEGDSRESPRDDGMAETPNRHVGKKEVADRTSPSTAEMKAAIRETRVRLAARLARTADHVHVLFTAPASAQAETRDGGSHRWRHQDDRCRRPDEARLERRQDERPPATGSDRRRDGGRCGRTRWQVTPSLGPSQFGVPHQSTRPREAR